jgi:hypothetical protein
MARLVSKKEFLHIHRLLDKYEKKDKFVVSVILTPVRDN